MKNFWIDRHQKRETEKKRKAIADVVDAVQTAVRRKLLAKYFFNPHRKP